MFERSILREHVEAFEARASELLARVRDTLAAADAERRDVTPAERERGDTMLDEADRLADVIDRTLD